MKNKSGSFLLPPAQATDQSSLQSPTVNEDIGKLLATIKKLETDLLNYKNDNHEDASKKCEDTTEKLKFYEEHSIKLESITKSTKKMSK